MIRSSLPDALPASLNNLKQVSSFGNEILKSEEAGKFETFVASDKESNQLAGLIYLQFQAAKADKAAGAINPARYVATLRVLQEWIKENLDINPEALHRDEIVVEINRYI